MKVLKKGNGQRGWSMKMDCTGAGNGGGGCGAKLLVEEDDIYETESGGMGESESHRTFRCPECRVETDFGQGVVPGNVWDRTHRSRPKRRKAAR